MLTFLNLDDLERGLSSIKIILKVDDFRIIRSLKRAIIKPNDRNDDDLEGERSKKSTIFAKIK